MKAKRLVMDTDYHDLTYCHKGEPSDLDRLFDNMAEAGFDATTWDSFWCGTALYHSKSMPVFRNAAKYESPIDLAHKLETFDPLAYALKLGSERNIQVLPYFRMLEEAYAPFDGDEFFRSNPEYWWQTRCGMYRMVGWPCYNYPEVREHMIERVDDLVEHGAQGVLFGLGRSHIPYNVAYRQGADGDSFGFNAPVVEEFKRRYGVDLSTFHHIEDVGTTNHRDLPFSYEFRWVGTEPYDMWAFRRLLGEGFELFLREARRRHPDLYIALEGGLMEMGGRPDEHAYDAVFRLNLEALCADGVVNEYVLPANYRQCPDISGLLFPRFQHVKDSGCRLTAWLNDFFTLTGGGLDVVSTEDVRSYVDRFLESDAEGAVIHEALFLLESSNPDELWKQLSRLK